MKGEGNKKLHKAIEELPSYQAPEGLWGSIDKELSEDESINRTIRFLPDYTAPNAIWEGVEASLEHKKENNVKRLWVYAGGLAASLLLVAIVWVAKYNSEVQELDFSQEVSYEFDLQVGEVGDNIEKEALSLIYGQDPNEIGNPEFGVLLAELKELDQELVVIERDFETYGQQPELIKAMVKIENMRTQVTKNLIKILVS